MTRFTFITWDGGGNVGPAVGIAQELAARGHAVRFLGYATQRAAIEQRGFAFSALRRGVKPNLSDPRLTPPDRLALMLSTVWACPEHLEDVPDDLAEHSADAVLVDFLMAGALAAVTRMQLPLAALVHVPVAAIGQPDTLLGAARLAPTNMLWERAGLRRLSEPMDTCRDIPTLITTIPDLDPAADHAPDNWRYVGPIAERMASVNWTTPWHADEARPLVVVSFTTSTHWDQRGRMRQTLAALAAEPVRVLLLGKEAPEITPLPANAVVHQYIPHDQIMPLASAVVTHCGHGTICAALAHGVPLVGLPNAAADQPSNAARLAELGAGVALEGESTPEEIREAVRAVLHEPAYVASAQRLARRIAAMPGVAGAAAQMERLARA